MVRLHSGRTAALVAGLPRPPMHPQHHRAVPGARHCVNIEPVPFRINPRQLGVLILDALRSTSRTGNGLLRSREPSSRTNETSENHHDCERPTHRICLADDLRQVRPAMLLFQLLQGSHLMVPSAMQVCLVSDHGVVWSPVSMMNGLSQPGVVHRPRASTSSAFFC